MYYSFFGTITLIKEDYLVIEVNDIGYQVYIARPNDFALFNKTKIYVDQVIKEDEEYLVGFSSLEEKKAYQSLIKVKGIGPKTALNALSKTSAFDLFQAIASNNISYLKKLPGIGTKAASQIILDLKGELQEGASANIEQYDEVRQALKNLGFKVKEIDDVLAKISIPNASNELILKEALKRLGRKNNG